MLHLFAQAGEAAFLNVLLSVLTVISHKRRASLMNIYLCCSITLHAATVCRRCSSLRPSHFEVLGLCADASPFDVKKKYHARSLSDHPDKHSQADSDAFLLISDAYESIRSREKIDQHRRFGFREESEYVQEVCVFYACTFVFTFITTRSDALRNAQMWTFTLLAFMCIYDIASSTFDVDGELATAACIPSFRVSEYMRICFPFLCFLLKAISIRTYKDPFYVIIDMIHRLHLKVDELQARRKQ